MGFVHPRQSQRPGSEEAELTPQFWDRLVIPKCIETMPTGKTHDSFPRQIQQKIQTYSINFNIPSINLIHGSIIQTIFLLCDCT